MFVCLLSWTFHDCLFVKLDISWLFVCLTGLCYDFGGQKMATRWRWHRFKIKNMKFSLLFSVFWWIFAKFSMIFANFLLIFAKFLMTFAKFSMTFAKFLMIFANFGQIFDDFWNFMRSPWHRSSMFGRSPVCQFCKNKTSWNISETFGNSQKESRNLSKIDFLRISINFDEFLDVPKPKTKPKTKQVCT